MVGAAAATAAATAAAAAAAAAADDDYENAPRQIHSGLALLKIFGNTPFRQALRATTYVHTCTHTTAVQYSTMVTLSIPARRLPTPTVLRCCLSACPSAFLSACLPSGALPD